MFIDKVASHNTYIQPAAPAPGSTIAVIAPSGAVDELRIEQACRVLESLGYRPQVAPDIRERQGYLAAGSDHSRAEAFTAAFADQGVAGVICARGGYGAMRILPLIDWGTVRQHPKFFCGFSDITALHCAIRKECKFITYHGGPMPRWQENDIANCWNDQFFLRAMTAPSPQSLGTIGGAAGLPVIETLVAGECEGVLEGGNLTLLSSLCGTPWQLNLKGCILLVEDVAEAPYRIDRSLTQLKLSGALDGIKGVVFGHSPTCEKKAEDEGFTLKEVIMDRLGSLGVPVIYGFACGHSHYRMTLPLGAPVRLNADEQTLTFL